MFHCDLIQCPKDCDGADTHQLEGHVNKAAFESFDWLVTSQCSRCATIWCVCSTCKFSRTQLCTDKQIVNHYRSQHLKTPIPKKVAASTDIINISALDKTSPQGLLPTEACTPAREYSSPKSDDACEQHILFQDDDDVIEDSSTPEIEQRVSDVWQDDSTMTSFSREESCLYFSLRQQQQEYAINSLVARSHFGCRDIDMDLISNLHQADSHMYMYLAYFSISLTPIQRNRLRTLLVFHSKYIAEKSKSQNFEQVSNYACLIPNVDQVDTQFPKFNATSVKIPVLPISNKESRLPFYEGPRSIVENLPHPLINTVENHSFVLPSDWLRHFFAFELRIPNASLLGNNTIGAAQHHTVFPQFHFFDSSRARSSSIFHYDRQDSDMSVPDGNKKYDKIYYPLLLSTWSDDFEPNYSLQNKGSVWAKTMSIFLTPGMKDGPQYTFLLATGKKGADHWQIESILENDFKSLRNHISPMECYSILHKQNVGVACDVILSIQDQLARRENTYTMAGNGTYSARWGYSFDWNSCSKVLPPCNACASTIKSALVHGDVDNMWMSSTLNCNHCTLWAFNINHTLLNTRVPSCFPTTDYLNFDSVLWKEDYGRHVLRPIKICFKEHTKLCKHVHRMITAKKWSVKQSKEYLKVHSINEKAVNEIIECAENALLLHTLRTESMESGESAILTEVENRRMKFPHLFQEWKPPSSWSSSYGIDVYSNAPMHLLSGIIKSTIKSIEKWISLNGYSAVKLNNECARKLCMVNDMKISWLTASRSFGNNFGGYVSENYICVGRLSGWLYSSVSSLSNGEPQEEDLLRPQRLWSKTLNTFWLRLRGLDDSGSAAELRQRVSSFMEMQEEDQPQPLYLLDSKINIISTLILSLNLLLSNLLCGYIKNASTVNQLSLRIRVFLTIFSELEQDIEKSHRKRKRAPTQVQSVNVDGEITGIVNGSKPKWIRSYNFMSLLNLTDEMRSLGSCRWHWEGSYRGEGYVRLLKPQIKSGLRSNWHHHFLQNHTKELALQSVIGELMESDYSKSLEFSQQGADLGERQEKKQYITYKSIVEVHSLIRQRKPISLCKLSTLGGAGSVDSSEWYVAVYRSPTLKFYVPVLFSLGTSVNSVSWGSMLYAQMDVSEDTTQYIGTDAGSIQDTTAESSPETHDFGVALPIINDQCLQDKFPEIDFDSGSGFYSLITMNWSEAFITKQPLAETLNK